MGGTSRLPLQVRYRRPPTAVARVASRAVVTQGEGTAEEKGRGDDGELGRGGELEDNAESTNGT